MHDDISFTASTLPEGYQVGPEADEVPSNVVNLTAKNLKATIAIDVAAIPFNKVPKKGTPGSKSMALPFHVKTPAGVIRMNLKVTTLQKIAETRLNHPDGGFFVIQGNLVGHFLEEAGVAFMPKVPKTPPPPTPAAQPASAQPQQGEQETGAQDPA